MKAGWEVKELSAVSAINYGYTESATSEPIGPRFLRITDIQDDCVDWASVPYCKIESAEIQKYRLLSGDIVFARTGATTGKSFLVREPPDAVFASYLIRLRLLDKHLLPEFVSLFFQTAGYWQSVRDGSSGSAQGGFNASKLGALSIPIPPLAEQQRIVGILDAAFDGIATAKANAEQNLQNARALFESHLQSVFTQRGAGWIEKTIGEACILRSGTTLSPTLEKPVGEIPYLKVADMNISANSNGITCSSRYVNKSDVSASNLLPVGTTIFPKRGGAILTNKKRLTTRLICADLNIMGVTPKSGLLPELLFYYFLRLDLREINNGSSIPQINNYSIEPLLISFPESTKEQLTIVVKLDALREETQRLESLYQRKLAALDELKKSLLHQAFSGQL